MQNTVTTSVLSNTPAIAATQQAVAIGVVQHDTAATAQATANVRLHFEQLAAERDHRLPIERLRLPRHTGG